MPTTSRHRPNRRVLVDNTGEECAVFTRGCDVHCAADVKVRALKTVQRVHP
jgi:hypothetical protein